MFPFKTGEKLILTFSSSCDSCFRGKKKKSLSLVIVTNIMSKWVLGLFVYFYNGVKKKEFCSKYTHYISLHHGGGMITHYFFQTWSPDLRRYIDNLLLCRRFHLTNGFVMNTNNYVKYLIWQIEHVSLKQFSPNKTRKMIFFLIRCQCLCFCIHIHFYNLFT